ncbi:hypothetical protein ACWC9T_21130 [Kitasatospora sp. NPDC001159]
MARLRLRYTTWPRPAIHLTDTPNPKCFDCDGIGSWAEETEYEGPEYIHCGCWDPGRTRHLLPVPRWIARRWLGWAEPVYSAEPPF